MTLRSDYFDGASGLNQQFADAFTAGSTFVTTNLATLSAGLITAASNGQTTFTVTMVTGYKNAALRLSGLIMKSYLAGISDALMTQGVYPFECTPALNVSSNTETSIDFKFTFQTA